MYWYRQRQNKRGRRKLARTVKDALEGGDEVCRAVKMCLTDVTELQPCTDTGGKRV